MDWCGNESRLCVLLHTLLKSKIWGLWVPLVWKMGWDQSPSWFAEPKDLQSSFLIRLGIQRNMSNSPSTLSIAVGGDSQRSWKCNERLRPSSSINQNTVDTGTLTYTGRPGGIKFITKLICFLFSKHFVTRFCFPSNANFTSWAIGCLRPFSFDLSFFLLSQSILQLLFTFVLWHSLPK